MNFSGRIARREKILTDSNSVCKNIQYYSKFTCFLQKNKVVECPLQWRFVGQQLRMGKNEYYHQIQRIKIYLFYINRFHLARGTAGGSLVRAERIIMILNIKQLMINRHNFAKNLLRSFLTPHGNQR